MGSAPRTVENNIYRETHITKENSRLARLAKEQFNGIE